MTYWDGTGWVEEPRSAPARPPSRLATWAATAVMIIGFGGIALPLQLTAAASHKATASACAVNPASADVNERYIVSAWGLPTGTAINLWVTHDGSTTGSPLGSTTDGTFNLNEISTTAGVWTYTFSGPTKVKNTRVYGTCSVSAY